MYVYILYHQYGPFPFSPSPIGPVMHKGSYFAANVHPAPDEETGKTGERSREGGGVGGGDLHRLVCDAMELS